MFQLSICAKSSQIAGVKHQTDDKSTVLVTAKVKIRKENSPYTQERVGLITFFGEFGQIDVAIGDSGPHYTDLTHRNRPKTTVEDVNRVVRCRPPYRNGLAVHMP